jgi:Cu/Ag efflux pump CusA
MKKTSPSDGSDAGWRQDSTQEISTIEKENGAAFIYRDDIKRYIGVKFSIRDRDLGGTIADAQKRG